MNKANTEMLFFKHSSLFPTRNKLNDTPNNLTLFGFECGDGWVNLLDELFTKIKTLNEDFIIVQVKEKYGGLRVYTSSGSDALYDLLDEAEKKSYTVCEDCGEDGKPRGSGWIRTQCEECLKAQEDASYRIGV